MFNLQKFKHNLCEFAHFLKLFLVAVLPAVAEAVLITNHPFIQELKKMVHVDYSGEVYLVKSESRAVDGKIFISVNDFSSVMSFAEVFYHELCHALGVKKELEAQSCARSLIEESMPWVKIHGLVDEPNFVPIRLRTKFFDILRLARNLQRR